MGYSPWGRKESDMTEHAHAMSNTNNNEAVTSPITMEFYTRI